MHELAIASSIHDTVMLEVAKRNLEIVAVIGLRIGALTDIVPDALIFGFESLSKDTLLEFTELKIKSIPIKGICNTCKKEFDVHEFIFVCPACYSVEINIFQGDELEIDFIEAE